MKAKLSHSEASRQWLAFIESRWVRKAEAPRWDLAARLQDKILKPDMCRSRRTLERTIGVEQTV
jgi:hypothetical protein